MSKLPSPQQDAKTSFGFWVYLMTDCILFASLFATFAVLRNSTYGNVAGSDIFELPFVLTETLILLTSSFTAGLATLAVHRADKPKVLLWLGVTFALGATFLGLEISEFRALASEGHSWRASAFLSAFFTLVGTHGLHITVGLFWMAVLMIRIWKRGLSPVNSKRTILLAMFWHFLDIVWIFIFTIVYLMGAAKL